MLIGLECPDGKNTTVKACLKACRMGHRCLTLPTLTELTRERIPKFDDGGRLQLSTTALINGTMYEYLKSTHNYSIKPKSRAFALLGTRHHQELSRWAGMLNLPSEESLTDDDRNMFDLLENEGSATNPVWVLTDYKTWGSFKVAKTFGITAVGAGHKEYYTDSYGKQRYRTVKNFEMHREDGDAFELEMQMNRYRLMIAEKHSVNISRMQAQITVRDGGLQMARQRGVDELMYLELVDFVTDSEVMEYFDFKQQQMNVAFDKDDVAICTARENWDDARCRGYCEIAEHCYHGRTVQTIQS